MSESHSWPSSADVARRLLILKYVVVRALATPPRDLFASWFMNWPEEERKKCVLDAEADRERFWEAIYAVGLRDYLSLWEQQFAKASLVSMIPQQQADACWRMESVQVLVWALQMMESLPPFDAMADHELLKSIPHERIDDFIGSAQLRRSEEIAKARDLVELWHWRSRTRFLIERGDEFKPNNSMVRAGIRSFDDIVRFTATRAEAARDIPKCINGDFPAKGKAYRDLTTEEWAETRSITMERHFALNWLCGYAPGNRWDETSTDT